MAYIGSDAATVVVDVSDPGRMREVDSYIHSDGVDALAVAGGRLLAVTGSGGLTVLDATRRRGIIPRGDFDFGEDSTWDIAATADLAYITVGRRLVILDIRDPSLPHIVGELDLGGPCPTSSSSDRRFTSRHP